MVPQVDWPSSLDAEPTIEIVTHIFPLLLARLGPQLQRQYVHFC